jgi:hypothetical protein
MGLCQFPGRYRRLRRRRPMTVARLTMAQGAKRERAAATMAATFSAPSVKHPLVSSTGRNPFETAMPITIKIPIRTVIESPCPAEVAKDTAEQRRIEAQGIADYNQTVAASLTKPMLEFDRIQELNRLAASSNAKTAVIGPGAGRTPVFLSTPTAASL